MYVVLVGTVPEPWAHRPAPLDAKVLNDALFSPSLAAWTALTVEAQDLISRLLSFYPKSRLSASGALRHPWWAAAKTAAGEVARPESTKALQDTLARRVIAQ